MDEIVLISTLNQFAFCPRRFALMQIEGIWEDNEHTVKGELIHETADLPGYEVNKGIKVIRSLPIYSNKYGLSGKADIVEYNKGLYTPVEYKKGRKRQFDNDDVQLCAQALCLEEMFFTKIPYGFIYHAESKKRRQVFFDSTLREKTVEVIRSVRELMQSGLTPPAQLKPRCNGCSLRELCLPELSDPAQRNVVLAKYQSVFKKD